MFSEFFIALDERFLSTRKTGELNRQREAQNGKFSPDLDAALPLSGISGCLQEK
jgi:hypothetical protein